jgi:hypothetical protein
MIVWIVSFDLNFSPNNTSSNLKERKLNMDRLDKIELLKTIPPNDNNFSF